MFGNDQLTFTSLLQQYKHGEEIVLQYKAPYNKYQDDLKTSLKYLAEQKQLLDSGLFKKIKNAGNKMQELEKAENQTEAIEQFIKERKKQLIELAFQQIGKSKYLVKINKESYYYAESIKNFREIFRDSEKAEETAVTILNKIPAFQKFMQQNSQLASLFGQPGATSSSANLAGLQTRASVNALIQNQIASGGPNAQQAFSQNIHAAQAELTKLKDELLNSALGGVGGSEGGELPDFKPQMQKVKTLKQRMVYNLNFQFAKSNNLMPSSTEIGLMAGFKINDKSVIGLGGSWKIGMGSIQHIQITQESVGLRSFIDWKLKKQFFVSGGYEMDYNTQFKNIEQLKNYDAWQHSALLGITKKISIKSKWFKESNLSLLHDFLYRKKIPNSQPFVFRVGYSIK